MIGSGLSYSLDSEIVGKIAVLYGNGWKVELDRDYNGSPTLEAHKDGAYLTYSFMTGEGHLNGSHFYGGRMEGLACMSESELASYGAAGW